MVTSRVIRIMIIGWNKQRLDPEAPELWIYWKVREMGYIFI